MLETVRKETEKTWLRAAKFSSVGHTGLSGAPGWSPMKVLLSGIDGGVRLKIIGLSGGAPDYPVSQRSPAPMVGRAIFVRHVDCSNGQLVHQTVSGAPISP